MELNIRLSVDKVLMEVLRSQPVSRAQIAKSCGLSKVTVSDCVEWLLSQNILKELGTADIKRGRPPVMLSVNNEAGVIVAIEVDQITSKIGVSDLNGNLIKWEPLPPIDQQPEHFMDTISTKLHEICLKYERLPLSIVGIGLGIFGVYNQVLGTIEYVANHASWNSYPIRTKLNEYCPGLPLLVGRQAQMSALGEATFGGLKDVARLACITSSWGTGVGIFSMNNNRRIIPDFFTRFGHTTIKYNGRVCSCGNRGCFEEYVSIRNLIKQFYPDRDPSLNLFYELKKRLTAGDVAVSQAIQEMCKYLAIGTVNVINAYIPTHICVSGLISELFDDAHMEEIRTSIEKIVPLSYRRKLRVERSRMGALSVLYGSFAYVRENLAHLLYEKTNHA